MNRSRTLATLAAFLLPLSACDKLTDSPDATAAKPTLSVVLSNSVIHPTDAPDYTVATIIAKAPAQGMSLSPMILDAAGNVVTDKFSTTFPRMPASTDSTFSTNEWKITSKISTPVGPYTFKVIVIDKKGQTASQTANFQVKADSSAVLPKGELSIEGWSAPSMVFTDDFTSPSGTLRFSSSFVELSVRIKTLGGTDVTEDFVLDYPSEVTLSPFDLERIGVTGPHATPGEYELVLTATDADGVEVTKKGRFTHEVSGEFEEDFIPEGPVTLGAQSNSNPSFLQIQGGTPISWTSTSKPVEKIDLVVGVDAEGVLCLMSPYQANDDGFTLSAWTTRNSTEIVGLGTEFPASRTEVETMMDNGGYAGNPEKAEVQAGYYYALRLSTGQVVVAQVSDLMGSGRTASIRMTLYY